MSKVDVDERILAIMRDNYKPGTAVEVVSVCGIEPGTVGIVKTVKVNGDVVIKVNGIEVCVKYPFEIIRPTFKNECILKMHRGKRDGECLDDCKRCGWNPVVEKTRREQIQAGKMVKGADGKYRLLVHKG